MRESIGGGWLMSIVVLFIVLFSSYLAVTINYTKAFKVKNYILSTIERREGYTKDNIVTGSSLVNLINTNPTADSAEIEIYKYLKEYGYYTDVIKDNYCEEKGLGKTMAGGFCLKHICNTTGIGAGNYYKVTTFLKIEFPVVNFVFKLPISGETKLIFYDVGELECE